jgi:hypothetical protein
VPLDLVDHLRLLSQRDFDSEGPVIRYTCQPEGADAVFTPYLASSARKVD